MKKESLYIGCSGYYYTEWKGFFYPEKTSGKDFLSLYSREFNTVEINSTFYRNPTVKSLSQWFEHTPEDFKFFIKIPKTITHVHKLINSKEEVIEFCDYIQQHLKEKLAGFLYQFPATFKNTPENIELIIKAINSDYLNVIEFRHKSWWQKEILNLCKARNIVFSGVSFPGDLPENVIVTHPEILYYRLHGKPVLYKSAYSEEFLKNLAIKIKESQRKSFIFFNNTWGMAAIHNSLYLKKLLE